MPPNVSVPPLITSANIAPAFIDILDDTGENVIGKWDKDGISIKEGAILADVIKGGTLQGVTIISEKDNHKIKLIDGEVKGYQSITAAQAAIQK